CAVQGASQPIAACKQSAARPQAPDGRIMRSLEAYRLDVVAVRVEQKRGVIVRTVVLAQSRSTVVTPAGLKPGAVEGVDGRARAGREREMHGRDGCGACAEPEPRGAAGGPDADAPLVAREHRVPELLQCRAVELRAALEIADLETDVIVHG